MEAVLGNSVGVYLGITVVIMGFAAYMTGQALALMWRPEWQVYFYSCLLAFGTRFLSFALFEGRLLSITGYLFDAVTLVAIALFAYRFNRARKMVSQYPWLYDRVGLFGWRERPGADSPRD